MEGGSGNGSRTGNGSGSGSGGDGSDSNSDDRRYLQHLGKKLLRNNSSSQRWSLIEKNEVNEIYEDIGVSLLEDNSENMSKNNMNDLSEDRENHSPNLKRSLKRSHSKANLSPESKKSPFKEQDINSAMSFGCSSQAILSPNFAAQVSKSDVASPSKITKVSPRKNRINESNMKLTNPSFGMSCQTNEGNAFDFDNKDSCQTDTSQSILSKQKTGSFNYKTINKEDVNENVANLELVHVSPLTTCIPHPPFHRYPKAMIRHTTFDDETSLNDMVHDNLAPNIQTSEEHDQTLEGADDLNCSIVIQHASEDYSNIPSTSAICDNKDVEADFKHIKCNKTESQNNDNNLEIFESIEKECFVAHNQSFCASCNKKSTPASISVVPNSDDESGFSKLFDEIILSVFQWLPKKMLVRCMLVCKRWHRLALHNSLWARVCLGGRVLNSGVLPSLMSRHPIVLRLANAQLISPVVPNEFVRIEWRVQYLDLSVASISPSCLASMLSLCPSLLRLSLEGLALSESAAVAIGRLSQLRVLNLALTTDLGLVGAKSISKLRKLEALNVAWTRLNTEATKALCEGLPPSLQRLNLSGFRHTLTEFMVKVVVERCPRLLELDLSDCVLLGDGLIPLLKNLKCLDHLAISRCNRLKKSDFLLFNNFPSLQWVDVFGLLSSDLMGELVPKLKFNQFVHSAIARPTVGNRRTSIWGLRTRD